MKFVVYGTPCPKGRPRVAMRGKFPVVYTPKATREAEDDFVAQAIKSKPRVPMAGALKVNLKFFRSKPKSYTKKITEWTQKPDLDNLVKLALDAMNNIFYYDDNQIVELSCSKQFSDEPRTEVIIESFK